MKPILKIAARMEAAACEPLDERCIYRQRHMPSSM
jgi:hypothetical protein